MEHYVGNQMVWTGKMLRKADRALACAGYAMLAAAIVALLLAQQTASLPYLYALLPLLLLTRILADRKAPRGREAAGFLVMDCLLRYAALIVGFNAVLPLGGQSDWQLAVGFCLATCMLALLLGQVIVHSMLWHHAREKY